MKRFIDFDEVRKLYPILEVLNRLLGTQLKQESPVKHRGPCPYCEDKRAFTVTTNAGHHGQGMAGCFKCGSKGDSISCISKKFGLRANEAAAYIVDHMGGNTIPATGNTIPSQGNSIPPQPVPAPAPAVAPPVQAPEPEDKMAKIRARLVFEHELVQALGLTPEVAQQRGIGWIKGGTMANRVLYPLFVNGVHKDYMGYNPSLNPIIKFPSHLIDAPTNVVHLHKKVG